MNSPRYPDDDQECMDPNLTEPKLQDDFDRRLGLNRRNRQRPRAAYGLKSAPDQFQQQQRRQTELTQIRYYKYVPYRGMSEPEKQKYLSLGPARLTSSRTAPPQPKTAAAASTAAASFWPSASRDKSLKVYDYHLAEMSMTYRSPPSLLDQPRRQLTTPNMSPRHQYQSQQQAPMSSSHRRPLFFQLHSSRGIPASAPSATQQELQQTSHRHVDLAEKTTQVSRGNTPFIDSALSDYPTQPRDVVSKSESNRLLNVVSVDECHVRHRRRRRRLRRVKQVQQPATEDGGDAWEHEAGEEGDEEEEEEEEEEGDWMENVAVEHVEDAAEKEAVPEPTAVTEEAQEFRQAPAELFVQLEQQEHPPSTTAAAVAPTVPSATTTRPTTERSRRGGRKKRRTEKEMRQIAAAKFLRRNEILREKMAIYLDWKLNQERMGLIELRLGDPAARFERFTVELVQQEAVIANQYRDGGSGAGGGDVGACGMDDDSAARTSQESPQLEAQRGGEANLLLRSSRQATVGAKQRQELSLTEMYEVLNS